MAANEPAAGEEYEYGLPWSPFTSRRTPTDLFYSYEALPPNFSLGNNMMAGAFAGIAVCELHGRLRNRTD